MEYDLVRKLPRNSCIWWGPFQDTKLVAYEMFGCEKVALMRIAEQYAERHIGLFFLAGRELKHRLFHLYDD